MARSKAPIDPSLAAARLRGLLQELEKEYGNSSQAAHRVGLSRSYVNRILTGDRTSVGQGAIDTVCNALGLDVRYFSQAEVKGSYKEHSYGRMLIPVGHAAWLTGDPIAATRNIAHMDAPLAAARTAIRATEIEGAPFFRLVRAALKAHGAGDFETAKALGTALATIVNEIDHVMATPRGSEAELVVERALDEVKNSVDAILDNPRC